MSGGRFMELFKHYGKVALGVHLSVYAATTAGLYVAAKNNVDLDCLLEKFGITPLYRVSESDDTTNTTTTTDASDLSIMEETEFRTPAVSELKRKSRTAEFAAYSGGALTLAVVLNEFLFPVRAPVTVALTPLVVRFLSRRRRVV